MPASSSARRPTVQYMNSEKRIPCHPERSEAKSRDLVFVAPSERSLDYARDDGGSAATANLYSSTTLSRRIRFFTTGSRCAVCSAITSRLHGQVESLCGKSLAHISW